MPTQVMARMRLPYLAEWRVAAFLTQSALSEHSGVAKSTISKLETGKTAANVSTIDKLIAGLGKAGLNLTRPQLINEAPPNAL